MDYKQLIDNLKDNDIFNLLEKLGAEPLDKGDYFLCKTICHNEDAEEASYKLYYYKNSHRFMCYTSCNSMSIFSFLQHYYETRSIPYDWTTDVLRVVQNCSDFKPVEGFVAPKYVTLKDKYRIQRKPQILETYPKGLLDIFIKTYPVEWLRDGISKKAMDKYDIRFSISQNKIIIPHYNVYGELVGIRGRALNKDEIALVGKYMPVQIEGKWYAHPLSMNLYGLNFNKENIRKYGICYVGEAEKFCLQMDSFSMPNCSVAVCGSQFNKYQLNLLIKTCMPREIVICFDQEELEGENKYFNKLYSLCKKYTNYCTISFIYDRKRLLDLKDSPTDKGEEVFRELLKRRIIVR